MNQRSRQQKAHILGLMLLALTIFASTTAVSVSATLEGINSTAQTDKEWLVYYDPDYNFTIEYPVDGWQPETIWHIIDANSYNIAKRTIFSAPQARIIIDIWDDPQADIVGWVYDYLHQSLVEQEITVNAKIAGFPGVAFVEKNEQAPIAIGIVFNNNEHFFLIQYLIGDGGDGINTYRHLLQSFTPKTENGNDLAGEFLFPLDVQREATKEAHAPLVNTCCGVTSNNNPFPCDNGNCTWWVWYKKSGVPMTGDAWRWGYRVNQGLYPGWYLVEDPVVYNIAWWDKSTARPGGHVAYVQGKSGYNSWINVNEMTWQGNPCAEEPVTRIIDLPSVGEPTGYIVRY